MIIHSCIECDDVQMIPIADRCPAIQKYTCPECSTTQYIYHSRLDPKTYSEYMVEEKDGKLFIDGKEFGKE